MMKKLILILKIVSSFLLGAYHKTRYTEWCTHRDLLLPLWLTSAPPYIDLQYHHDVVVAGVFCFTVI